MPPDSARCLTSAHPLGSFGKEPNHLFREYIVPALETTYPEIGLWLLQRHQTRSPWRLQFPSGTEYLIVDLNSIRSALKEEPFQPFDLCLTDGRRIAVTHPEFVAMTNLIVVVLDEHSYSRTIEPLLIVSVEPKRAAGNGSGKHGKRRRS